MQTKLHSLIEAVANTASGFVLAFLSTIYVFPLFGVEMNTKQNVLATSWMTLLSIARSYVLRRVFNRRRAR